jgi:ribosomal protein S18 acetylase RimI-like enzyme
VDIRVATASDAEAIASLHAESWRENYRGAYADAFLDGDVFADRRRVWTDRLGAPEGRAVTIVADEQGAVAGFAHVILDDDPTWGALLDNLHVAPAFKRRGIGRELMAASAEAVIARAPGSSMFLWVLETNAAAQAFYRRLGGTCEGSEETQPPGGGTVVGLRYVWRDPSTLLG